jgi:hypothetical protein
LKLDGNQARVPIAKRKQMIYGCKGDTTFSYKVYSRGVLPKLPHLMHFVDRMLMTIVKVPREDIKGGL